MSGFWLQNDVNLIRVHVYLAHDHICFTDKDAFGRDVRLGATTHGEIGTVKYFTSNLDTYNRKISAIANTAAGINSVFVQGHELDFWNKLKAEDGTFWFYKEDRVHKVLSLSIYSRHIELQTNASHVLLICRCFGGRTSTVKTSPFTWATKRNRASLKSFSQ